MTVVTVDVEGSGLGPVPMALGPMVLPRRAGVLLDAEPWPDWVPAGVYPAHAVAGRLALSGRSLVAVACPALVSPARSMLALGVGRALADRRATGGAGPVPLVMCGVRPHCAWHVGVVIVPHPVTIHTPDGQQHRIVWEILDRDRVPGWVASLRPADVWPVAA
ncbi:hypothetical protein [Pseudofrankia asymbiotica]|uniref:Uncharacterized protein n=1 Tax=Pseudofrankia asymbiotica TaxID=1834516 RepID=A0A1V2I1F5_9ACTN|nr:hypothetical protein [Pseudofrankia asymbiotica]ONH22118.1 hypothetical protein BL253_36670 [Pseudofrankia asymbiotica]